MPTSSPRAANDPAATGERRTGNSRNRPATAAVEHSAAGPAPDLAREAVIRLHAYRLWERRGHSHGHAMDDWLQAEQELGHLGGMATARLPRSRAESAR